MNLRRHRRLMAQVDTVNTLDLTILGALNVVAKHSWAFDAVVTGIADNRLLKGGVMMVLLWWAWFRGNADERPRDREHVIATILSCLFALAVARVLVVVLPFRHRPMFEEALDFVVPYGIEDTVVADDSSFPSDHAVLFFGLVMGLFFISRRAGIFALLCTLATIALPRMYLGLHYFSDIVAGGAIGAAISWTGNRYLPATRALQAVHRLSMSVPMYFYPVMFIVTFEIAELFDSGRTIAKGLVQVFG